MKNQKSVFPLGILTGGGDCPGLNAVIRAVVCRSYRGSIPVVGIEEGFHGLMEGRFRDLNPHNVQGLLTQGGTILGATRINPLKHRGGVGKILQQIRTRGLGTLIAVGGEGTMKIAWALAKKGVRIVGVPKTIDNDVAGTDLTFGFDTAVHIAAEAIDRLHTTAESHNRVMIIEVMGRHVGWIAAYAGLAGGADAVMIPETPFSMKELISIIRQREQRGRHYSIVVVSEDAKIRLDDKPGKKTLRTPVQKDEYGNLKVGGIAEILAGELRKRIPDEVRVTVLGHVQRGGTPTAFDRVLATRLGVAAAEMALRGKAGVMVGLKGNRIQAVPLSVPAGPIKKLDPEIYQAARVFFG